MKDYLVIIPSGRDSYHTYLENEDKKLRNFDVAIIYYHDDKYKYESNVDYIEYDKGPKWQLIRRFLKKYSKEWKKYKYIWFPDDDLKIVTKNKDVHKGQIEELNQLFEIAHSLDLSLCQPSLLGKKDDEISSEYIKNIQEIVSEIYNLSIKKNIHTLESAYQIRNKYNELIKKNKNDYFKKKNNLVNRIIYNIGHFHLIRKYSLKDKKIRFTSYVEVQCPLFKTSTFKNIYPYVNTDIVQAGFGLDDVWCDYLSNKDSKIAIIDFITVQHMRNVGHIIYDKYLKNKIKKEELPEHFRSINKSIQEEKELNIKNYLKKLNKKNISNSILKYVKNDIKIFNFEFIMIDRMKKYVKNISNIISNGFLDITKLSPCNIKLDDKEYNTETGYISDIYLLNDDMIIKKTDYTKIKGSNKAIDLKSKEKLKREFYKSSKNENNFIKIINEKLNKYSHIFPLYYGTLECSGYDFIVMEKLGQNFLNYIFKLSKKIKTKKDNSYTIKSCRKIIGILLQVLFFVYHLNIDLNIIHNDLNLKNILIGKQYKNNKLTYKIKDNKDYKLNKTKSYPIVIDYQYSKQAKHYDSPFLDTFPFSHTIKIKGDDGNYKYISVSSKLRRIIIFCNCLVSKKEKEEALKKTGYKNEYSLIDSGYFDEMISKRTEKEILEIYNHHINTKQLIYYPDALGELLYKVKLKLFSKFDCGNIKPPQKEKILLFLIKEYYKIYQNIEDYIFKKE